AYQGSRRFHIIGLEPELVREVFRGAPQALGTLDLENLGEQLGRPHLTLDPVHQLLEPKAGEEIDLAAVESVEEILSRLVTRAPLEITDNRAAVDLVSLATAEEVLLTPPAHHDTVGPDGLRVLIDELRNVNPQVRLHVRVGADLTSGIIGLEAIHAGADVIDLVDGEYEWAFGRISLAQRFAPDGAAPRRSSAPVAAAGGNTGFAPRRTGSSRPRTFANCVPGPESATWPMRSVGATCSIGPWPWRRGAMRGSTPPRSVAAPGIF